MHQSSISALNYRGEYKNDINRNILFHKYMRHIAIRKDAIIMLGLKANTVHLVPYNTEWNTLFQNTKEALAPLFGTNAVAIEHIGSTAIDMPGNMAKPILDVNITVRDAEAIPYDALEKLGYMFKGDFGIPGRYFFVHYSGEDIANHHIHCYLDGHPNHVDNLLFRDYLKAHPDCAMDYSALKTELAAKYAEDRASYTAAKTDFVMRVLTLARASSCNNLTE